MVERIGCVAVGYLLGCFLMADVVSRWRLGISAFEVGTRNPGMANIGSLLGTNAAIVVLAGDIGKTAVACIIAQNAIAPDLGQLALLYAVLGTVLGHDFPFWHRFIGGKGVAVTCTGIVLFDPIVGGLCCLIGFVAILISKYLPIGAILISLSFVVGVAIAYGTGEALWLACALLALMVMKHGGPFVRACQGVEPKTHLFDHRE
jgi:glycerol-3-phosphate acyltransferase PlsY